MISKNFISKKELNKVVDKEHLMITRKKNGSLVLN
jgi:hypothetical protein